MTERYDVRPLTAAELPAAHRLGLLAFGGDPATRAPDPAAAGLHRWGAFDAQDRLVAKATDLEQGQWFGGRLVSAAGVGGVAVAPEARGRGLAQRVLVALLASARERGGAVSALFATAPALYRRLGWERVGALAWSVLPTAALAGVRVPDTVALRAAEPADVPALRDLYAEVARAGNGYLERSGPLFPTEPEQLLASVDGITVVDGPAGPDGYVSWQRGRGYDASARLTAYDVVARTGDGTRALLATLGSWSAVAPTLALRLPEPDPATLLTPTGGARIEDVQPWMLRLVDAPAAIAARGWPAYLRGGVDLEIVDPVCGWNAGRWRLGVEDGAGRLEPGGRGEVVLPVGGLAVLYAAAADPAVLRRAGLLTGGDAGSDGWLRAAFAGPEPALLDYF